MLKLKIAPLLRIEFKKVFQGVQFFQFNFNIDFNFHLDFATYLHFENFK